MKVLGIALCALAAVLLADYPVAGAIIEVPDEWVQGVEPAYDDEGSLREKRQVELSGGGGQNKGTVRIDGQTNLFDNGKTKVDANGFYQRSWQQGYPPHNSGGIGAGVSHEVWRGRGGQSLDVYGGYQRQYNTPSRHNANGGFRFRF